MTMRRSRSLPRALLLGAVLLAAPAAAQKVDPQSLGAAQALYDTAQGMMKARKYDEACPKLEEVVRLVPAGVGAKLTLARCYDEAGRLASAWAAYLVAENAATTAGQADRAKTARERAAALKPKLSTLTIRVPASIRDVPGLEVKRDSAAVSQPEWGVAIPVDAGAHTIAVSARGKKPWQGSVDVKGDSVSASIDVPDKLEDDPSAKAPAAPAPAPEAQSGGLPVWAFVVGGLGLAAGGVGVAFAIDQRAVQADIDAACANGKTCAKGFDAKGANARLYRDFGLFVGLGAGGVAAITAGVIGLALAPKKKAAPASSAIPRVWASPAAAGLGWEGGF